MFYRAQEALCIGAAVITYQRVHMVVYYVWRSNRKHYHFLARWVRVRIVWGRRVNRIWRVKYATAVFIFVAWRAVSREAYVGMFIINLYAMIAAHANAKSSLELKCHGKYVCIVVCLIIGNSHGKETVNRKWNMKWIILFKFRGSLNQELI